MVFAVYRPSAMPNPGYREVVARHLFSAEQCAEVLQLTRQSRWEIAGVTNHTSMKSRYDAEVRSAIQQPLPVDGWPAADLFDAIADVNSKHHRFDLWGVPTTDGPSIVRYEAGAGDHFAPHQDAGASSSTRKLTFVVQLTPEDDYVGGDLILLEGGVGSPRAQGTLIVFPSFLLHVVTPVVSGTRNAIVGWAHGPAFR